jgi:nucleoside-diphosphate-sugar epimerase
MKVLVTGATGFVGRHVVAELAVAGHQILAVARSPDRLSDMPWRNAASFLACDIHSADFEGALAFAPDVLVHLAWPGLPNYQHAFHFETNLPADFRFLKRAAEYGIGRILVTGTGAEFGLQSGALAEDAITDPSNAYGIAKDSLRRFLQHLQLSQPFVLQWVRLFHIYGPGQNPGSLLAQLDRAIEEGATSFDMSGGEQLRDYLPVQEVARRISLLVSRPDIQGVINCCSGTPISVKQLVEKRIAELGAKLELNLGAYPYPDYEPMAYWGSVGKLAVLLKEQP